MLRGEAAGRQNSVGVWCGEATGGAGARADIARAAAWVAMREEGRVEGTLGVAWVGGRVAAVGERVVERGMM